MVFLVSVARWSSSPRKRWTVSPSGVFFVEALVSALAERLPDRLKQIGRHESLGDHLGEGQGNVGLHPHLIKKRGECNQAEGSPFLVHERQPLVSNPDDSIEADQRIAH